MFWLLFVVNPKCPCHNDSLYIEHKMAKHINNPTIAAPVAPVGRLMQYEHK